MGLIASSICAIATSAFLVICTLVASGALSKPACGGGGTCARASTIPSSSMNSVTTVSVPRCAHVMSANCCLISLMASSCAELALHGALPRLHRFDGRPDDAASGRASHLCGLESPGGRSSTPNGATMSTRPHGGAARAAQKVGSQLRRA